MKNFPFLHYDFKLIFFKRLTAFIVVTETSEYFQYREFTLSIYRITCQSKIDITAISDALRISSGLSP